MTTTTISFYSLRIIEEFRRAREDAAAQAQLDADIAAHEQQMDEEWELRS